MPALPFLRTAASALSLVATLSHAGIVYQQAAAPVVTSALISQFGPDQGGFQVIDDFSVERDATISRVTWRGGYVDPTPGQMNPAESNSDIWLIEFWWGDSLGPRRQIYRENYRATEATRTALGRQVVGLEVFDLYDFALDLTLEFDVVAGGQYWFSVLSKSSTFNPHFVWTDAGTDGSSFQRQYTGGGIGFGNSMRGGNRAFSLETAEVPEPASLALVCTALLAGGLATRRGRGTRG